MTHFLNVLLVDFCWRPTFKKDGAARCQVSEGEVGKGPRRCGPP